MFNENEQKEMKESDITISNPEELDKLIDSFEGLDKLHVVADFDRTLTKAFVDGKSIPSLISVLRDENYLTPGYPQKAQALYDKYSVIEKDPNIFEEEKKKAMEEWWRAHFKLLIESGLNKADIEKAVQSSNISFREGSDKFFNYLSSNNIPLIIISSSGMGKDAIELVLKREDKLTDNIHIVSNSFNYDKRGNAVSVIEPVIHNMNKDETAVQNLPFFGLIKNKKNVLLLGDSLGDIKMVEGFDYDGLIKIGFLNENIEESLDEYKEKYDIVILNDSSLEYINNLLNRIK